MMRKLWAVIGTVVGVLVGIGGVEAGTIRQGTDKVLVSAVSRFDELNPQQGMGILLKFQMQDGWHIFSQNPGDIGMPTQTEWQLPSGAAASELGWSCDEEFVNDDIVQRGYGRTAYYQAMLRFADTSAGTAKLKVKWLACREECVPEQTTFAFNWPQSLQPQAETAEWQAELKAAEPWYAAERPAADQPTLGWIFLWAFAGGVIMNAMPCIFPILAIKVVALAKGSYNRRKTRLEALFYTLGVVTCFVLAATILLGLRLQGEHVGWGFQLQSPWFVAIMAGVFVLIGLMLLEVIILPNPLANKAGKMSFRNHLLNSFMTGLLAVLVASPCTAPFMGVAIGYTLSAPVYMYYPVFLALSLGYALPFALAEMFPQLVHRILPKPGKWMLVLQRIFAIPVFLTAAWLLWVLYHQLASSPASELAWQEYNQAQVAELVAQKQPVFVDFTAKWCLTCLMNKRSTLDTEDFAKLANQRHLHLFRADWTNHSQQIGQALESYGRNSIPLYVYYGAQSAEYQILPQILTPSIIREYIGD